MIIPLSSKKKLDIKLWTTISDAARFIIVQAILAADGIMFSGCPFIKK